MNHNFYTIPCMPRQNAHPSVCVDYVPHGVATTDMAAKIMPTIVAHFINVCTGSAQTAPRIAYLNTVAQNGWINNETVQAYRDVLDMLRIMVQENRISTPVDGIQGAVEAVIVFRVSTLCAGDPGIVQYIDVDVQNEMRRRTEEYANFRATVQQYRQASEQTRYAQTYQNMNLTAAFNGGSVGSGMFTNTTTSNSEGNVDGMNGEVSSGNHYQRLAAEARKRAAAEQEASLGNFGLPIASYHHPVAAASALPVEVPVVDVRWIPSDEQHYVELYRPRTQEYEIQTVTLAEDVIGINGLPTNTINRFVIKNKENPMDREKHITSLTTETQRKLMVEVPAHYRSRGEALENTMKAIAANVTTKPEDRDPEIVEFLQKNLRRSGYMRGSVFSLKEAVDRTWLYHKAESGEFFTATAFLQDFSMVTNFVTVGDYFEEVERIMTMVMPLRITDEIRVVMAMDDTPAEMRSVLVRIDKLVTKAINSILLNKLSLDVAIDSFTSDYDALLGLLRGKYADVYYESFVREMNRLIHKQMRLVKNSDVLSLTLSSEEETGADGTPEPKRIRTNSFGFRNPITITTMDVLAAELELGFYKQDGFDMPARIMESNHSILFWYAKSLFDSVDPIVSEHSRHYLVTADDEYFELHRGLIGKENYLLSRVIAA